MNSLGCITYRAGYRYQLQRPCTVLVPLLPPQAIWTPFVDLSAQGELWMSAGYAWDGPSGPVLHTPALMRGSLVHDALYQLMREGHLDHAVHRAAADQILRSVCLADGMGRLQAWAVYQAVRVFGGPAADPAVARPPELAPRRCRTAQPHPRSDA